VTPDEWKDFSDKNILKSEREKNAAINLRSIVDGVLIQTYNDVVKQFDIVNVALENRIEETEKAKNKLETHLTKVFCQIICVSPYSPMSVSWNENRLSFLICSKKNDIF
jgi:hypothetical protein